MGSGSTRERSLARDLGRGAGSRRDGSRRRAAFPTFALSLALALAACELQEITVTEAADVVVVEGLVQVGAPGGGTRVLVLLHRTVGGAGAPGPEVPGATVTVELPDGSTRIVPEISDTGRCVASGPEEALGSCYRLDAVSGIGPGQRVELRVETAEGGVLEAATVVPGAFDRVVPRQDLSACVLESATPLELAWTGSEGARAYVAETEIFGLRAALEPRGIEVDEEPFYLLGLSVSASDTTLVYPAEFGLFERFDLDRDLALVLQEGLPPATQAFVSVAAVDQNYVNWVRGGNFNPSGPVRVPSVRGDGTGFFGSAVVEVFGILVDPAPGGGTYSEPACAGG